MERGRKREVLVFTPKCGVICSDKLDFLANQQSQQNPMQRLSCKPAMRFKFVSEKFSGPEADALSVSIYTNDLH